MPQNTVCQTVLSEEEQLFTKTNRYLSIENITHNTTTVNNAFPSNKKLTFVRAFKIFTGN